MFWCRSIGDWSMTWLPSRCQKISNCITQNENQKRALSKASLWNSSPETVFFQTETSYWCILKANFSFFVSPIKLPAIVGTKNIARTLIYTLRCSNRLIRIAFSYLIYGVIGCQIKRMSFTFKNRSRTTMNLFSQQSTRFSLLTFQPLLGTIPKIKPANAPT